METAKKFIEKLNSDEAFSNEINAAIQAKKDANAPDYADAIVAVAAERGYEVTVEQVRKLREAQSEVLSEEELGKAAGGQLIKRQNDPVNPVTMYATWPGQLLYNPTDC